MKLVEQLAAYYQLSQHAEVNHRWCRWWLPQGEARIAYLRELFEPVAKTSAEQMDDSDQRQWR
ncbi:hypothetical protein FHU10_4843 [Serratia fonticola]|uniref:Uncharacterized protein n=1 Tax=Serratia fonticola TaxID=47917 RepID=A0A542BNX2_SERFO|nr:hypothetical protein [Serratia fonticola]TQI80296.1 hypothetical protein FHU09_2860 [Serratia fonticola]TQI97677.1 hypothetical protein FHU11_3183 [Serratia fonticola]TVZ72175.1 hypothetical protein FHU10_4843 [Serratia fonticola]